MSEDFNRNNSSMVPRPPYYRGNNQNNIPEPTPAPKPDVPHHSRGSERPIRPTPKERDNRNRNKTNNGSGLKKIKNKISRLSPLGILAFGAPVIVVILIFVLIISLIAGVGGSKVKVHTSQVSVGEMHSTYTQRGYCYINSQDIYRISFIDDDYAQHGIQKSTSGTAINTEDNSSYNLNVTEIREYTKENDDGMYATLLNIFKQDNGISDNTTDETASDEYQSDGYTEAETEAAGDFSDTEKHVVVIMTVSIPAVDELTLKDNSFVNVELITQSNPNAISVPSSSIISDGDDHYVLVVSGKKANKVNVSIGAIADDITEIISKDISKDTVIVTDAEGVNLASIETGTKIKVLKDAD